MFLCFLGTTDGGSGYSTRRLILFIRVWVVVVEVVVATTFTFVDSTVLRGFSSWSDSGNGGLACSALDEGQGGELAVGDSIRFETVSSQRRYSSNS